jgi:hypothetical protein
LRISILTLMDEDNPIDEISRIEARLDELAEVSERCRKIILASKVAIAGGAALLLVTMLGLLGSNQVTAIGSIALVIGGIVSPGSNVSTLRETMAAMSAAEALRSDLISRIDLRVVGDGTMNGINVARDGSPLRFQSAGLTGRQPLCNDREETLHFVPQVRDRLAIAREMPQQALLEETIKQRIEGAPGDDRLSATK